MYKMAVITLPTIFSRSCEYLVVFNRKKIVYKLSNTQRTHKYIHIAPITIHHK